MNTRIGPTDKIDILKKRKQAIDERMRRLESQLSAKARKDDTRTKILLGAALLAHSEIDQHLKALIRDVLSRGITRPKDRSFLQKMGWLDT